MLSLNRTLTVGYLSQHPTRTALVMVSIALGVAVLVATQALNRGLKSVAHKSVNPLGEMADLLVGNNQGGVSADLAAEMRAAKDDIPGLADARPAILTRVAVNDLKNRSVWFFGFDLGTLNEPGEESALGPALPAAIKEKFGVELRYTFKGNVPLELWRGRALAFVDPKLAEAVAKEHPDDPAHFTIRIAGKKPGVTILGTTSFDPAEVDLGDSAIVTDVRTASALAYPSDPGLVSQINVTIEPGADKDQVRDKLREWLAARGSSAQVQTIEASRATVTDVTAGLELGFSVGGAGALVIGLFLVYNILSVSVAERRHDIGILRSVGATRGQIARLFMLEAAGLGFLGSVLGVPLGLGLAWLAVRPLGQVISDLLIPLDRPAIDVSPVVMVLALLAGTLVAVLAALVPALEAAGEEPADAVRRVPRRHAVLFVVGQIGGTLVLLLIGFAFIEFRARLPVRVGVFGGVVSLLVGALFFMPVLAALVGRVIQPFFRHFLGLEGRLAADNLVRSPGRTGLVIGALAATAGLMVMTAGFLHSSEAALFKWVEEKIAAELFVTSGSAVTSGGFALSMNEKLKDELLSLPQVEAALGVRSYQLKYNDRIVFLIALDRQAFEHGGQHRALARNLKRFARFGQPGTCLVSENFAALNGVGVGDTLTIPGTGDRFHDLEIVGTVEDYTWNRGTILVDRAWFRKEFADHQLDVVDLYLKPGADPEEVRREILDRWGKEEALFVITRPQLNADVRSALQRVYSMAYAQQTVVGLVALLGVVSALFISVLQRRRELGLLRAVGASRGQILRSVLAEAVLMGIIGAVVGFGIGLVLEWYVLDIVLLDEAGFIFPLKVPWLAAGIVTGAAVVLATVAGLWPAYHATRLRIPDAIAYE